MAHVFGERTLATLERLLSLLSAFEVVVWMTDGWPLYESAPLLDTIRSAYSLTTAQTGLLTTLPLLAFALISPLAAPVARRFGMERSLFAALLLICAGIAIRSLPSPYLLFGLSESLWFVLKVMIDNGKE